MHSLFSRSFSSLLLVAMCSLIVACTSAPEPYEAKTRVYRDGYFARQVTYVPAKWNSQGREYESFCLYSQLVQSPVDGGWYCPPDNSIDMLKTKIAMAQTVNTPTYRETVLPMIGQAAIGAGIGGGLAAQGAARMTQSVTGSVSGSPIKTSTLLINGPVPPGVAQ
jgi:hypothetical protein